MIQPNPAIEILSHLLPRHFFKDAIFHRAKPREKPFHLHANHTPARLHLSRALNSLNSLQQHPIWRKKKRNLLVKKGEKRRKGEGKTEAKFKPKWIREKRLEFEIQIQQRFTETRGRRDWCRFWRKETSWDREKGE